MFEGWRADPSVILGAIGAAVFYVAAARRVAAHPNRAGYPTAGQMAAYAGGLVVLFLALESPLDEWGDEYLFSVHMVQHLLLILVVPPCMLGGLTQGMVAPLFTRLPGRAVLAYLTRPLPAFLLFNGIFSVAHLPNVYDLVLSHEPIHIAEHILFIASGFCMWWPVAGPYDFNPRLNHPVRIGYLFLQTLPCSAVAALITLSTEAFYVHYTRAERLLPLSALQDQQIGGLVMWIGMPLYLFGAMSVLFFQWAAGEETSQSVPLLTTEVRLHQP